MKTIQIKLNIGITMRISFITFLLIISSLSAQNSYELKDGSTINGTVILESETQITIETNFGVVTISKSDILAKIYKVDLNSGDSIFGEKIFEDENIIRLKTNYGEVDLNKSDITSITEKGKKIEDKQVQPLYYPQRPLGLAGLLFGGHTMDKDSDFSLGEEQLIDLFFDPTGYTLDQGTLYLSGLSFAFGISEKFHVSSKWSGFFYNDFNIRPKYKVLDIGNWEKQHALSVGLHYHTNWWSDKVEWKNGEVKVNDTTMFWGGYYQIDDNPKYEETQDCWDNNGIEECNGEKYVYEVGSSVNENEYNNMIEFFSAYTYSTAREGLKGRTSHTFGANIQLPANRDYFYRVYYGLDIDINRKLKMIGEVFYDPSYASRDGWFRDDNYEFQLDELSDSQVLEPTVSSDNLHLDFGFMYALNESFRFGLHFQPYIFAFYWKF